MKDYHSHHLPVVDISQNEDTVLSVDSKNADIRRVKHAALTVTTNGRKLLLTIS